ncbi:MAG: bifunctional lysine ketoglutarate reductase /saccharopine dehydrogenase family protein [Gemmatimonadales bacterium]
MTIGIRAEDKNRWERRAPLTPDHVRELAGEQGVNVVVEPSTLRVFPDRDYREAGADLDPALSAARVIFGVKEIPVDKLVAGKVYAFFPHVTKGQDYNMGMLRRMLDLGCTLIDYEQVTDRRGRRLIFFGRHAGYAGMIDSLWALGQRLAAEGFVTPLEEIRLARQYADLEDALDHLSSVGDRIRHGGLPPGLRPIVTAFTGSGNVAQGAREVYDRFPVQEIDPDELPGLDEDRDRPRNAIYRTVLDRGHRYRRADGGFDAAEFAERPDRYRSALDELLPHLTMLIHGAYWEPSQPQLVRRDQLVALFTEEAQPKLRVIGDITCDINGSIASTVRPTDSGDPVYVYDPVAGTDQPGVAARGVVVMAVDNLPCELPADASQHFGDGLVRFVGALDRCDWTAPLDQLALPAELSRAVIAHRGRLAPPFAGLEADLAAAGFPSTHA